jgi:hypothetical protein
MQMGMKVKILTPGVENGEEADLSTQPGVWDRQRW